MFGSDDYAALGPVRERGFKEMNILLTRSLQVATTRPMHATVPARDFGHEL